MTGSIPAPRRLYAVARGSNTGIFDNWKTVLTSVSGFPSAKYKSFRRQPDAKEWYLQQLQILGVIPVEKDLSDDDGDDGETVNFDPTGLPPGYQYTQTTRIQTTQTATVLPTLAEIPIRTSNADLVDFRMAGPDPSTGDSKKIHDVAINVSTEIRKLLCPKGITQEMQTRMLEVTPDVLTCQGKTAMIKPGLEFEVESMWNRFAGNMTDMADVQAQKIGSQLRDTQWTPNLKELARKSQVSEQCPGAV
jgi:hypothetical protein